MTARFEFASSNNTISTSLHTKPANVRAFLIYELYKVKTDGSDLYKNCHTILIYSNYVIDILFLKLRKVTLP